MEKITQLELIFEFFKKHPNRDIEHPEVVDWASTEYKKRTGKVFRDPDRAIRSLHQQGYLIKVKKGVYRYEPNSVHLNELQDFTEKQKEIILKRDGYKCVICGRSAKEGYELHIDHIIPKDKGGKATIENGQTLCSMHNFRKKNYNQTESGKKMFIRLYELAKSINDEEYMRFCEDILKIYEKHNINGHIEWEKK